MSGKAIVVKTDLLAAVARWTPSDNFRPHLRVVMFKGDEMVAIDGKRMVRVPIQCNGLVIALDRDLILAATDAQAHCKDRTPQDENGCRAIRITIDDGPSKRAHLDLGRFKLSGPLGDDEFYPPYESVMPVGRPAQAPDGYGFSAKYLAAMHEVEMAAGAIEGAHGLRVISWSEDHLGPMLFEGYMGIRYVIMPMRV